MRTFSQFIRFAFGLRRNTAARRTPEALQVDRSNVYPIRRDHRGPQRPAPFAIAIELRDGGVRYVRPIAKAPGAA